MSRGKSPLTPEIIFALGKILSALTSIHITEDIIRTVCRTTGITPPQPSQMAQQRLPVWESNSSAYNDRQSHGSAQGFYYESSVSLRCFKHTYGLVEREALPPRTIFQGDDNPGQRRRQ